MRLASHILATFANLTAGILSVGIALKAPDGAGGLVFGLVAALCVFNMYAHIHMADDAS